MQKTDREAFGEQNRTPTVMVQGWVQIPQGKGHFGGIHVPALYKVYSIETMQGVSAVMSGFPGCSDVTCRQIALASLVYSSFQHYWAASPTHSA